MEMGISVVDFGGKIKNKIIKNNDLRMTNRYSLAIIYI